MDTQKQRVTLCFDILSPYSFFAFEVLLRYERLWDIEVELRPVSLGVIMRSTHNNPPANVEAKGKWMMKDLARNAEWMRVPFRGTPSTFLKKEWNSIPVLRVLLAAQNMKGPRHPQTEQLIRACYHHAFRDNVRQPVTFDDGMVRTCARAAGLTESEVEQLLEMAQTPEIKEKLKSNTAETLEEGAFGAPTFILHSLPRGRRIIFGADRFEQIAYLLKKPYLGPSPDAQAIAKL